MKPTEKIENLVQQLKLEPAADLRQRTIRDARAAQDIEGSPAPASRPGGVWSTIMHAKLVKVAAVVALVAAAAVFVAVLQKTETKAWAIENTIQALQDVRCIMFKGVYRPDISSDVDMDCTIWALANAKRSGAAKTRAEAWGMTRISDPNVGYLWNPHGGTAYINRPGEYNFYPWFDGRYFDKLRSGKLGEFQISYGKDSETGKECAFITCSLPKNNGPKSWWYEIDTTTGMPVRFKQWMNANWQGKPQLDAGTVLYNPELPGDFFDAKVPQGAIETKGRVELSIVAQAVAALGTRPGCGVVIDGLANDEAAKKLVTDYYNAVLTGDWDTVRQIRTDALPVDWAKVYGGSNPVHALVKVGQPYMPKDWHIMAILVPCTLSYQDGSTAEKHLIVTFKPVDGKAYYAIIGTWLPNQ
jgi:hypothetical protein